MASSKVEIASPASPFGCVLRNHNWRLNRNNRENCNNVQTNITYFVHDHHFNTSMSDPTPLENPRDGGEWLDNQEQNTIKDQTRQNSQRKRESSPLSDDSSVETNNMGCVSSLVQRWREFSDTKPVTKIVNNPNNCDSSNEKVSASGENNCDSIVEKFETPRSEKFETPCGEQFDTPSMAINDNALSDVHSDRVVQMGTPSTQSHVTEDNGETEKLRVADVIRKLRLENASNENGTEVKLKEQEKRCFSSPVIGCTPRFRGRQAFTDLLMQLERDRHMELDTLVERKAVSKFSHRGRIQSFLRLRFLRGDGINRHHHQQQHSKVIVPQQRSHSTPVPAPQQPVSCEKSIIVDNPQVLSSSLNETETQKPEAIVVKQEQPVSKLVAKQNSREREALEGKHSESISSEHNQVSQGSKVVLLREKFNVLDITDVATQKTPRGVAKNNNPSKSSSTINQLKEELHRKQDVDISARSSCSSQNSGVKEKEEVSSSSCFDPSLTETSCEVENTCSLETEKILTVSNWELRSKLEERGDNVSVLRKERISKADNICLSESEKIPIISNEWAPSNNLEECDQYNLASLRQETNCEVGNIFSPESEKTMTILNEKDQNDQGSSVYQTLESGEEWINNDVQYWGEWDEEYVSNLNWVSDIARPKSDWENLRQERYRDMLDSDQENEEMRRLLERRSVSSFLTSNLRDTMDQLMISRAERVPTSTINNHKPEHIEATQVQTQTNIRKIEEEEEEEEVEGGGGADSNFSDQVRYTSLEQPRSSQSSCPDTQPLSSLTNRSSMDMEFMYDIRAYMEQLQQEVSELRKTVKSCINMQENMQFSIKQEVAAAVDFSVGRAVRGSANDNTRTRNCCLCYEMPVDSLLYRCGHMCTCFKCAHELQWSTGKCPICRAPIVDIVRAYPDNNFFDRR